MEEASRTFRWRRSAEGHGGRRPGAQGTCRTVSPADPIGHGLPEYGVLCIDRGIGRQALTLGEAFAGELKKETNLEDPPFEEPLHWTWGAVQEGLIELSGANGKSVEKILLAVGRQASEQREQSEAALKAGVPKLELALVQHGTALTNEYHGKVLGGSTKLLGLYGQAQAARLGLNIVQPVGASNGDGEVQE
jgi:hypothetical protein